MLRNISQPAKALVAIFAVVTLTIGCGAAEDDEDEDQLSIKGSIGASSSLTSTSGIDPSSFYLQVHKVGFSSSAYCTDPTTFDLDGEYMNFSETPDLGGVDLADGDYPCVMIEMSSIVRITPSETSDNGHCEAGVEFNMDVCTTGAVGTLIDETAVTCTTDTNDRVSLYLSTAAEEAGEDVYSGDTYPFSAPPTESNTRTGGSTLLSALTVSGATTGTFVVGAANSVGEEERDGSTSCGMAEPSWSFQ